MFIERFFPPEYSAKKSVVYTALRCDGVHDWFLHRATISGTRNEPSHLEGRINVSLYDLFRDLRAAFEKYAVALEFDAQLCWNFRKRFDHVRGYS